MGHLQGFH